MVARSGRRIIRPREWMEIAKNSRKQMCTGGCPTEAWTEGARRAWKEVPVPLLQLREPIPELLYRCSINECRRNGRMCGLGILRNAAASEQLSHHHGDY